MIRLICFDGYFTSQKADRLHITPSVISRIPEWEKLILEHNAHETAACDVDWPIERDENDDCMQAYLDNWKFLMDEYILKQDDLPFVKNIVISRFLPSILESRAKFLEQYIKDPIVFKQMTKALRLYCPIGDFKDKTKLRKWIVV